MASNAIAFTFAQQREPSRQQHPKSNKHPSSRSPHAQNPSPTINRTTNSPTTESAQGRTEQVARAPLLCAFTTRPTHARTTCEAARRCPKPPRGAKAPAAAPRQPSHHDDPPHTVTSTHPTPPLESR